MFALFAPALALAQLPATTVLAPDTEARWVPFERTQTNQIRFALQIGGHSAQAILDTGLSDTIVTTRLAAAAALTPQSSQRARAIGGSVAIAWAQNSVLVMGGLTRRGGRIGISDALGQQRFGADVLLGADVLGCCAIEIDPDARRLRVLPSGRLAFTGLTVPLRQPRGGVYLSQAVLNGRRLRPLIVDTGDGASLTLSRAAWLSTGYRPGAVTTTLGWGLGGAVVTDTAIASGLAFEGGPTLDSEVRIEGERGYSAQLGVAGRIGGGLLLRYRMLLDPRAGRMVLRPVAAAEPVLRSTSGLLLEYAGASLRVLHVMRGSPAEAGGWRVDETICAADGVAVAPGARDGNLADWTAGKPGRTVRLRLCDGTERSLTLRAFY